MWGILRVSTDKRASGYPFSYARAGFHSKSSVATARLLRTLIRTVEPGYLRLANQLRAKRSFSLLDRLLVNHRLAFRLADVTLEPLTHLLGELLISDEAAKVIGKLIVEYRLET
jgi:hypothetical protein